MKALKIFSIIFFVLTVVAEIYAMVLLITTMSAVLGDDAGLTFVSILALLPMFILIALVVLGLTIIQTILTKIHNNKMLNNGLDVSKLLRIFGIISWTFVILNILGFAFFYIYPSLKK